MNESGLHNDTPKGLRRLPSLFVSRIAKHSLFAAQSDHAAAQHSTLIADSCRPVDSIGDDLVLVVLELMEDLPAND